MVLCEESIRKHDAGISKRELQKFLAFVDTHQVLQIDIDGRTVPYYACGKGEKTILTFAGFGVPELMYETVLGFEDQYKLVVVDFTVFESLADFSSGVNTILEKEGVGRVFVLGQSMTGIVAQAYFKRNLEKIDAMVITNTLAPRRERNKAFGLILFRILPFSILRILLGKKLSKLGDYDIKASPEAEERIRFKMALMKDIWENRISKKKLLKIIKMSLEFNEKDEEPPEDFKLWKGKVLIITCEDDPYYKDAEILKKNLPNSEMYAFPKGMKHVAPMLELDTFQKIIKDFLGP